MLKQALTGTGLAIGATLWSAGQVLAVSFNIDTFNVQFADPFVNSQVASGSLRTVLRTGTSFPTSSGFPATIESAPGTLPDNQVIGGERDLNLFSIQNTNNLTTSGSSRVVPSSSIGGFWQVSASNGSRVSSSMIWDNIDPFAAASESNSGRFLERLSVGSLAFRTLNVIPGSANPDFQPVFTFTIGDVNGNFSTVSRTGVASNSLVFIRFTEFQAAANNLLFDLNAVNYVELNITTGGESSSTVRVDLVQGFEIPEPSLVLGLGTVFGIGLLSTKGTGKRTREN